MKPPSSAATTERVNPLSRREILAVPLLALPAATLPLLAGLTTAQPGWVVRNGWVLKAGDR